MLNHKTARKPRVLFVIKASPTGTPGSGGYGCGGGGDGGSRPSGISISALQIVKALQDLGYETKIVCVENNNFIHQEVVAYGPTHVIIEGFWVVPDKFVTLAAMNPGIEWLVRCHSNTEFLAHEGNVFGWAIDYLDRGVTVAFNSPDIKKVVDRLVRERTPRPTGTAVYLPNYYDVDVKLSLPHQWMMKLWIRRSQVKIPGEFHVGCFGAVRPLKNHMNQAIASIEVAQRIGLKLRFYINANPAEDQDELISSLRSLFKRMAPHELIEVPWMNHKDFLGLLTEMDIVSQVSCSETFNIVLADSVSCGIPVIGANIPWLDPEYEAEPNDVQQIAKVMHHTWLRSGNETVQHQQRRSLVNYVKQSSRLWSTFLTS